MCESSTLAYDIDEVASRPNGLNAQTSAAGVWTRWYN